MISDVETCAAVAASSWETQRLECAERDAREEYERALLLEYIYPGPFQSVRLLVATVRLARAVKARQ